MPSKPVPFPVPVDEIVPLSEHYDPPYDILFLTCYLYGARIGEALQLNKNDLVTSHDSGRDMLVATLVTEKNKHTPLRVLPAILSGNDLNPFQEEEAKITEKLQEYNSALETKAELFPGITRQLAYNNFARQEIEVKAIATHPERKIVELENFKLHPHYLRHVRLTHLVTEYDYSIARLMRYAGWSDPRPAAVYLQLNWRSLAKGMEARE